jgi:RHS repeat-associated protein
LASLSFDANGNMTVDEQGRTFIWDAWNRLVEVKQGSTTLVEYQYDGLKRRIVEDDGTSERHLYYSDQWQVLEERVGGDTVTQYVWSAVYVDAMILRDRDADASSGNGLEQRIYVLHDANYNVTAIVDEDGNVIERYYYEAYGSAVYLDDEFVMLPDGQSEHAWQHLHQGGRLDTITSNYHFRHRDLSPTLGRWISQDPIGFEAGDANLYRYVGNGPVGHLDPLGLQESIFPGGLGSEKPATINEELSGRKFLERIGKAVGAFIRQQPQVRQLEEDIKEQGEQLLNRAFPFWKAKEPKKPGALIEFPESDDPWHPPLKPRPVKEPLWKRMKFFWDDGIGINF